jgi:hypothetical protein
MAAHVPVAAVFHLGVRGADDLAGRDAALDQRTIRQGILLADQRLPDRDDVFRVGLLRWRRVLATAGHRLPGDVWLRQSRAGENAEKTEPLFVTPDYTAGNGCYGAGRAGRALRRGKLRQCQESNGGKREKGCFRFHVALPLETAPTCEELQ